jgi:hypothetical protein
MPTRNGSSSSNSLNNDLRPVSVVRINEETPFGKGFNAGDLGRDFLQDRKDFYRSMATQNAGDAIGAEKDIFTARNRMLAMFGKNGIDPYQAGAQITNGSLAKERADNVAKNLATIIRTVGENNGVAGAIGTSKAAEPEIRKFFERVITQVATPNPELSYKQGWDKTVSTFLNDLYAGLEESGFRVEQIREIQSEILPRVIHRVESVVNAEVSNIVRDKTGRI